MVLAVELLAEQRNAFAGDRAQELVERVREDLHAFFDELRGHGINRDAGLRRSVAMSLSGLLDILLEGGLHSTMIAEGVHRCGRHCADRFRGDQFLDIKHVAVGGVLGPGTRPQQPLDACALGPKLLPPRAGEKALVALIGKFRICDRDLTAEPGELGTLVSVVRLTKALVDELVHRLRRCDSRRS